MKLRLKVWLVFILLCAIWGSTWLAIRLSLNGIPPITGAALRMCVAGLLLLLLAVATRTPFPRTAAFAGQVAIQGSFQFGINFALVYWAEQHVPSGLTAVLFSIAPLTTALAATYIFRIERLHAINVVGLLLGFAGVIIIYWAEVIKTTHVPALGVGAVLLAATFASTATVAAKRWYQHISPLAIVSAGQFFGGIELSVIAALSERHMTVHFTPVALGATAYLIVFGSGIAFLGFFYLIKHMQVTRLSLVTYVTPVTAVLLGWIILHERLAPQTFAGIALVFAGIGLVHRQPATPIAQGAPQVESS